MINMLIHDKALGASPSLKNVQNTFAVTSANSEKNIKGDPIEYIWDWTAECAKRNGGIKNLLIACHGAYIRTFKTTELVGGFGILLGTGIFNSNVQLTQKLQGRVSNIYMYVCGAAKAPDKLDDLIEGQCMDPDALINNRWICKQIAALTKANVYASPEMQDFNDYLGFCPFDFKNWEGKVEKFAPDGTIRDVTSRMKNFGEETGNE